MSVMGGALRGCAAAFLAAGMMLGIPVAAGAVIPARGAVVPQHATSAATPDVGWSIEEAEAEIDKHVIARVGDAPAQVDTAAVTKALTGSDVRVVLLPFKPLDDAGREAAGSQGSELASRARRDGYELVMVQGLTVSFSIYDVVPSSLAEMQPVLAEMDVTSQVLYGISQARDDKSSDAGSSDAEELEHVTADPALVTAVGDALADGRIYNSPKLALPQRIAGNWRDGADGVTLRAAFFPPADRGAPLPDLATALHERFPDDIIVVVHGRWMDVASPRPELAHSAILWTYGYYQRGVLGWDVQPTALVGLLAERIASLRSGVTIDEDVPADPADPVTSVSKALPWIFGGGALALVIAVTAYQVIGGQRRRMQGRDAALAAERERGRLGARIALMAGQIVAIEPLASDAPANKDLALAMERQATARDLLATGASVTAVRDAVQEAETHLKAVSKHVGVPLASPPGLASLDDLTADPEGAR